jgi:hypothetical protein
MSEYLSNRKRNLNIGIESYTENDLVLDVIGNTNISGITSIGGDLYVKGVVIAVVPQRLSDLLDVEITGSPDKYVLMYDSTSQKWKNLNPDEVLYNATVDQSLGYDGLPAEFEEKLNIDLNNKIDLDAGTF